MKIVLGVESGREGEVILKGKKVGLNGGGDGMREGVGMVDEEFMVAGWVTV